jgi:hypothetical protein
MAERTNVLGTSVFHLGVIVAMLACASTEPPPRAPSPRSPSPPAADGPTFHRPYRESANNFLYNLLFCDNLALFQPRGSAPPAGALAVLLSSNPPTADVEQIANDEKEESRLRLLAFNYLRSRNVKVPERHLLGVVVEVPLGGGLDALAVFADGRIRYINHSGKLAIFEATPDAMSEERTALMQASERAVAKIGPWDKPRRPPPVEGNIRLTFLVSDGLYFGEGPSMAIEQDPIGGPVMRAATQLLVKIVGATTK